MKNECLGGQLPAHQQQNKHLHPVSAGSEQPATEQQRQIGQRQHHIHPHQGGRRLQPAPTEPLEGQHDEGATQQYGQRNPLAAQQQ